MPNLSTEILKIKKGDVVIIAKDFSLKQFDFKQSALTWWGSNISSVFNMIAKDSFERGRIYAKDDLLFIATKDGQIDNRGKGILYGYAGGWDIHDTYSISYYDLDYPYDEFITQIIILTLINKFAKIIPYTELDLDKKNTIESYCLINRVISALNKEKSVIYDNMIVTNYEWKHNNIVLSGFDCVTKNEIPKKMVALTEFKNFIITGKKVNTNLF